MRKIWVLVGDVFLREYKKSVQRRTARLVKMCFDGVDWSAQTFTTDGGFIKNKQGEAHFYPCKDIDKAIKKLNRVLAKLK